MPKVFNKEEGSLHFSHRPSGKRLTLRPGANSVSEADMRQFAGHFAHKANSIQQLVEMHDTPVIIDVPNDPVVIDKPKPKKAKKQECLEQLNETV